MCYLKFHKVVCNIILSMLTTYDEFPRARKKPQEAAKGPTYNAETPPKRPNKHNV